jgi:zinc/manganese transport system substrate-binding protein
MKKGIILIALLLTMISFGTAKLKIVASTSDLAEFTKIVGGDKVDVDFIVRGTQNPHFIEVKPSYMMKLKSAQAFVMIGMQMEIWAPQIIDGSRNAHLQIIDCSKNIDKLEVPVGKVEASQGDVHPAGNPHYWLDPENVPVILHEIVNGLALLSPIDKNYFQVNADAYNKLLQSKLTEWKQKLAPYKDAKIISYHTSFSYFIKRFGIQVAGYVEPKPGIPPTPTHAAELMQLMKSGSIKVIGLEQFYEDGTPNSIARSVGASVVKLSTSIGGVSSGTDSYIQLMEYNVNALANAFARTKG